MGGEGLGIVTKERKSVKTFLSLLFQAKRFSLKSMATCLQNALKFPFGRKYWNKVLQMVAWYYTWFWSEISASLSHFLLLFFLLEGKLLEPFKKWLFTVKTWTGNYACFSSSLPRPATATYQSATSPWKASRQICCYASSPLGESQG